MREESEGEREYHRLLEMSPEALATYASETNIMGWDEPHFGPLIQAMTDNIFALDASVKAWEIDERERNNCRPPRPWSPVAVGIVCAVIGAIAGMGFA